MKRLCVILGLLASSVASANDVFLSKVHTDAAPGMKCDFFATVSETNELVGAQYNCGGTREERKSFTLEEIRRGVVLFHYDPINLDAIILYGPQLDSVQGGPIVLRYLSNYLKGEYADWHATLELQEGVWTSFTSPAHLPFNDVFALKRTVLGQPVGIKEIRATWIGLENNI
jgi:hypothetical protein